MNRSNAAFAHNPVSGAALEARLDEILGLVHIPGLESPVDAANSRDLTRLAFHLADALERTQRQLIESNIQLMSLREVTTTLLSLHSLEKAAETIALYLHKAFDYERVAVLLLDTERGSLEGWLAARHQDRHLNEPLVLPLDGAAGDLIEGLRVGRALLLNPAPTAPIYRGAVGWPACFAAQEINSALVVPLRAPGQENALGAIVAARSDPSPPLESSDLALLESMAGSVTTVVEQARLHAEVQEGKRFRDDVLNSMTAGIVVVDLEGHTTMLNRSAMELTGFGRDEVAGVTPPFVPADDPSFNRLLDEALHGRPFLRREALLQRADGTTFPASLTTSPLRDERGGVRGAIAAFVDLTEIRKMEERIRQLDRLAVLGRFTAAIAHEIRNPLTGVSTGVQYLTRDMGEDSEKREHARFILSEVDRLNRIVEDLFRVTHPHPLQTSPVPLAGLLERALLSLAGLPEKTGVRVLRRWAPELSAVPLDADQMQQVAINLIKNALEATPEGGTVTLSTGTRGGRTGEPHWAWFRVHDTGAGMSPETMKNIFEPFFTNKQQGTGLGLYITHGIVERHGGHLRVDSREGEGAAFTVELPLRSLPHGGEE